MKSKIVTLLTVIAISFLGFTNICTAATIFTDNFNSYSDGNLNDQGGWTVATSDIYFTVESSVVNEGSKAIKSNTILPQFDIGIKKTGTLLNDGSFVIYVRAETETSNGIIRLFETPLGPENPKVLIQFTAGGFSYRGSLGNNVGFGPDITLNTWYAVQVQWRSIDHNVRYNINNGIWTPWVPAAEAWIQGIATVNLERRAGLDNVIYFDTIQENSLPTKTPVLIVPGILGTEIYAGDKKLWLDLGHNFTDIGDEFMDPLKFQSNLVPINSNLILGDIVRKPSTLFDYSDGLINEFHNHNQIENENLFTFPYDWRYGVSGKYTDGKTNSDLLAQKIQDILTQTGSDKVDVVAHSMGGLIIKKYVIDHPIDHHVGKAIFVGVPNIGSPKTIKVLLQGDHFNIPWLSESEIKKISTNMPAAYDLLPTQQYYDIKGSFVKITNDASFEAHTEKDLNYSEFENYITQDHNLNSQALTNAENLHTADFDNFDLRTVGVDLYAIDGCKTGTISKIVETRYKNLFGHTTTSYANLGFNIGDGTVPISSSTNLPIDQDHKFYSLNADHGKMLSQDGTRQEIVNLLTGSNVDVGNKIIQDISKCKLNGKDISVFSPVDIFVTDQDSNHVGIADDGSIVNEIPNADFEIMGEHKFLYLLTDEGQVYDIKIKGTGTGTFTIGVQNIVDTQEGSKEVFSNIPVTPDLTGQINLGSQTTLTVKQTSNSPNETILPSATLDANQSEDFVPPVSVATLSGTQGKPGFYRSDVKTLLNATDNTAGVLALNYNIDGLGYQKILSNTTTFSVTKEGSHTITFFATDNAGNNEQEQIITFVIDKTAPEATIEFDPTAKDLKFSEQEEGVAVTDKDDAITLTDQAGNVTEIKLKDKDRKKSMSAQIKSLKYNGVASDISKNIMQYRWNYDKNKNIKKLSQHVKSRKDYNVFADFDGKNTKFEGRDEGGKISKLFSGLKIIKILTDKGDFNWSY